MLWAIGQGTPHHSRLSPGVGRRSVMRYNDGPLQGTALVSALRAHARRRQARVDRRRPTTGWNGMCRIAPSMRCVAWCRTRAHRARHHERGRIARQILDHWSVHLADIQGKPAGTHKCDNLRSLIANYTEVYGRRPRLWFVEDRLETLQHVTTHADLADVGLFLADWGYNTAETRAMVQSGGPYPPADARPVQARSYGVALRADSRTPWLWHC